jgi:Zn-dependent membrane protease YugP
LTRQAIAPKGFVHDHPRLGLILLIAGFLLKISILWTIGIIVLITGVVLAVLGATGRAVGGRRHYF